MDGKEFEDIIQKDIQKQINFQIHKCMKHWGIEGTLEKIETLYSEMPKLKEIWITEYNNILKG